MIENEIDLIRSACNDHLLLSADISEAIAEFEEELAQIIDESFFKVALLIHGEIRKSGEFKRIRLFDNILRLLNDLSFP